MILFEQNSVELLLLLHGSQIGTENYVFRENIIFFKSIQISFVFLSRCRSNGTTGPQRSLRGPSNGPANGVASPYHVTANGKQKDTSMLDKFKLFNNKEKDTTRTKIGEPFGLLIELFIN